jgi:hypothetical protein
MYVNLRTTTYLSQLKLRNTYHLLERVPLFICTVGNFFLNDTGGLLRTVHTPYSGKA